MSKRSLALGLAVIFSGTAGAAPVSPAVKLDELIGSRPAIVSFWASWCEPCREELPALQQYSEKLRGRGIILVTVAVKDWHAKSYLEAHDLHLPLVDDRENVLGRKWKVHVLPTTFVLDERRRILLHRIGEIDFESLQSKIQRLLDKEKK